MNVLNSVPSLTHPRLQIRDTTDAHILLEAVRLKVLPLIKHRLAEHERAQLQSGQVYVWEESHDQSSLSRWTDGRRWSQSRTRGDCLFYQEKIEMTFEEKQAKAARRALKDADLMLCRRTDRPSKVDGLTKQTYSANVRMLDSGEIRKWHIVAYYTDHDLPRLPLIDDFDYLQRIRVPDAIYTSSHLYKSSNSTAFERPPGPDTEKSHKILEFSREISPSFQFVQWTDAVLPRLAVSDPIASAGVKLPPLSSIGPISQWRPQPRGAARAPLYSEDRRTLNKFRIVI
ncbi:Gti1/Pac2 family-domain-containing protein [Mycena rebaudengoi]|nr:Gti1/Pac2 family-domain-containing protein [Mycena rebaudengoi]KAJ7239647.1 Gti1/Pac2 family-domain-containing protein [Mycena rebaudengoi]